MVRISYLKGGIVMTEYLTEVTAISSKGDVYKRQDF